jgi:hypothetical protein
VGVGTFLSEPPARDDALGSGEPAGSLYKAACTTMRRWVLSNVRHQTLQVTWPLPACATEQFFRGPANSAGRRRFRSADRGLPLFAGGQSLRGLVRRSLFTAGTFLA